MAPAFVRGRRGLLDLGGYLHSLVSGVCLDLLRMELGFGGRLYLHDSGIASALGSSRPAENLRRREREARALSVHMKSNFIAVDFVLIPLFIRPEAEISGSCRA